MAALSRLASAIADLAAVLEDAQTPFMIIGGIAVLVWGEPRTTQDIDVTVSVPEDGLADFVDLLRSRLTVLPANPVDFFQGTHVLPVTTPTGVSIDIIRAGLPYEEQAIRRAVLRDLGPVRIRVCTAEDLIVHKLASTRPRDREDVVGIVARQRLLLDRSYLDPLVQSLSETLEDPEIWARYQRLMEV